MRYILYKFSKAPGAAMDNFPLQRQDQNLLNREGSRHRGIMSGIWSGVVMILERSRESTGLTLQTGGGCGA